MRCRTCNGNCFHCSCGYKEPKKQKELLAVSGLWTRMIGGKCEVLIEVNGEWRLADTIYPDSNHGHIMEASYLGKCPKDYL